jgi:hypothetical protein
MVMIGLAERRQGKADSQQLPAQKLAIPVAEPVLASSKTSEEDEEEQGSTKRSKASGESRVADLGSTKKGGNRAAEAVQLGQESADEAISAFPPLQATRSARPGRSQTGVEAIGKGKGDKGAGRGVGNAGKGGGQESGGHAAVRSEVGEQGYQAAAETQAPTAGFREEQSQRGRVRVKEQGVCPFCHEPTGLVGQHNWKECTVGRFVIPAPHKQDHRKCWVCGHQHPFDECPVWTEQGAGGLPMFSEDCLVMCEHMGVPSYKVGGSTYVNLSGKRLVSVADTDSVEGSGSEASAVVCGSNLSIEQVKGSTDPKLFQLMELISADSRQIREELVKVTTQLEAQVQATALQGGTLVRVMDQMCELQTATSGRIDAIQKSQSEAAMVQSKALERMDEALAKMRAGDKAVVGPPGTLMQS